MGGGGEGGGGPPRSSSGGIPSSKTIDEVEKELEQKTKEAIEKSEEKSDVKNLQNNENDIKNFVKEEMNKGSEKIPWDHNDHSINHVERVLKESPNVIQHLEKISFSEEFLNGNKLSDLDKEILKYAIILHDIGYSKSIKEHSTASKKYIEKINRGIKSEIVKEIALIAQLHTPEGIKKLGGRSLSDIVKKGIISDRVAYLASILTISDALDAGKQRVMSNSQNESAKNVIDRIKKKYSEGKAESKLEHWYGHQCFSNPNQSRDKNTIFLNIQLNTDLSEKHSAKIAFRVVDIISDITASYLTKSSKFKLELNILSKDIGKAKNWYNENNLIFQGEEKLSNVNYKTT